MKKPGKNARRHRDARRRNFESPQGRWPPKSQRKKAARKPPSPPPKLGEGRAAAATVNRRKWENYIDLTTEWHPLDVSVCSAPTVSRSSRSPAGWQRFFATRIAGRQAWQQNYQLIGKTTLTNITGIKLEMLPPTACPIMAPASSPDGNFVLGEHCSSPILSTPNAKRKAGGVAANAQNPKADFEQNNFPIGEALKKAIATAAGLSAPKVASVTKPSSAKNPSATKAAPATASR